MHLDATEYWGKLVDELKHRGVDRDTCCGIVLSLGSEDKYREMFGWIKQNPRADQTAIMQHMYIMCRKTSCAAAT